MHPFRTLGLRPFLPSGADYDLALRFYRAVGFDIEWEHDGLAGLRFGGASFLLQRFECPDWQANQMLVLNVDDLDAFWKHVAALDLAANFPGARVSPPKDYPWGREAHLVDPAGVCWHARAWPSPPVARPVVLEGRHVRLEPLSLAHVDGLAAVGLDEEIWRWNPGQVRTRAEMEAYVRTALGEAERGVSLPFATIARRSSAESTPSGVPPSDVVAGSTRFGNVDLAHRRVEIGWTWLGRAWQRTAVNTEAKLLLLRHAFEVLGCQRVELKTDALNARSRAAIQRIGALEEGTFKKHSVTSTGRVRDTVYYAITDDRWPEVERGLVARTDPRPE